MKTGPHLTPEASLLGHEAKEPMRPEQHENKRREAPTAVDLLDSKRGKRAAGGRAQLAAGLKNAPAARGQRAAKKKSIFQVPPEVWSQVLANAEFTPPDLSKLVSAFAGWAPADALAVAAQDNQLMRGYTPAAEQGEPSLLGAYDQRIQRRRLAGLIGVVNTLSKDHLQKGISKFFLDRTDISDYDLILALMARGCRVWLPMIGPSLLKEPNIVRGLLQGGERLEQIVARGGTAAFADRELLALGLRSSPQGLKLLAEHVAADRELTAIALQAFPTAFQDAHPSLLSDKNFVLQALAMQVKRNDGEFHRPAERLLSNLPAAMQDDREVVMAAIEKSGISFFDASARWQDDELVASAALAVEWKCSTWVSRRLRDNKEFVLNHVGRPGFAFEWASDRLRDDREVVLAAVANQGSDLAHASERLRDNEEVVKVAVSSDNNAIRFASFRWRDDEAMVKMALLGTHSFLHGVSPRLQDDAKTVLAAVEKDDSAIQLASPRLQDDEAFVLAAMEVNPSSFKGASPRLQADMKMISAFVNLTIARQQHAVSEPKNDYEAALAAIKFSWSTFRHLPSALRENRSFVLEALKTRYENFGFIPEMFLADLAGDAFDDRQFVEQVLFATGNNEAAVVVFRDASLTLRNDVALARQALLLAKDVDDGAAADLYLEAIGPVAKQDKEVTMMALQSGFFGDFERFEDLVLSVPLRLRNNDPQVSGAVVQFMHRYLDSMDS